MDRVNAIFLKGDTPFRRYIVQLLMDDPCFLVKMGEG